MTTKKIFLISLFIIAIIIMILVTTAQHSEIVYEPTTSPKNRYHVDASLTDMTLSLSSGDIFGVRVSEEIPAIVISIGLDECGRLIIDNPVQNLRKAFPDSYFEEYVILVDGEEVAIDEISMNIVAISVKENSQRIEIVPITWLS